MKKMLTQWAASLVFIAQITGAAANTWVGFDSFNYSGWDTNQPPEKTNGYSNPIQSGFYPDPSLVRVGETYYMTHSTFSFFPGLPIFKSNNLVDWEQIGHAISDRKQLTFEKQLGISRGIFAPTLRYHEGMFYIITTDVDGIGNFIISAKDPAGPWSDPIVLPEIGGIDPDLFFDDDGRVYVAHNEAPDGEPLYEGHRAIWLWELDWPKMKAIPKSRRLLINGGVDISKKPVWIEGPHILKKDGWYYLTCAEGGTSLQHSQVVFRTRDIAEPFIPYANNPILTQRDLDPNRANPITSVGHADFVQTPDGDWWTVFLGIRPYKGEYHNTGRETFLLPLTWKDGWPHILAPNKPVPSFVKTDALGKLDQIAHNPRKWSWKDKFDQSPLDFKWVTARSTPVQFYQLDTKRKRLQILASKTPLSSKDHASMLVVRQQHLNFNINTRMLLPKDANVQAGLIDYQNDEFHYFLAVEKSKVGHQIFLETVNNGVITRGAKQPIKSQQSTIELGFEQIDDKLNFFYFDDTSKRIDVAKGVDATLVSTKVAGGFTGAMVGVHARTQKPN